MDQKRLQDLLVRIKAHPTNVLDRFVVAKMYHDAAMWDESLEACKEILELKPDYLVVCIMMGESLVRSNRSQEAKKVLEKAKELAISQNHNGMIPEIEELLEEIG